MWDAIRWAAATVAFAARWLLWLRSVPVNIVDGVEYFEEPTRVGIRASVPVVFEIAPSSRVSMFRAGRQSDSGDQEFDRRASIRSGSEVFLAGLAADASLRSTILQLVTGSDRVLYGDGFALWLDGEEYPSIDDLHRLNEVRVRLEALTLPRSSLPHFDLRMAAVGSIMWALTTYAFGSILEHFASGLLGTNGQLHVTPVAVVASGFVLAIFLTALFMGLAAGLLGRSPQGRRLFLPQPIALTLGVWLVGSIQLTSDLNRHLDVSRPVTINRRILRRDVHSANDGRHYWLLFSSEDGTTVMKDAELEVSEMDYWRSLTGPDVELHIRRGWLGLPWYQDIEFPSARTKK